MFELEQTIPVQHIRALSPCAGETGCSSLLRRWRNRAMTPSSGFHSHVHLNIGGKKFTTTIDTLTQREPDSMLAAMFSGRHTVASDPEKEVIVVDRDGKKSSRLLTVSLQGVIFVDRDGKLFRYILNWLRDGTIDGLTESEYEGLLREAEYYQVLSAKLKGTNLQGANLQRAYLRQVDLRETQLEGAKLDGANLLGAIR